MQCILFSEPTNLQPLEVLKFDVKYFWKSTKLEEFQTMENQMRLGGLQAQDICQETSLN